MLSPWKAVAGLAAVAVVGVASVVWVSAARTDRARGDSPAASPQKGNPPGAERADEARAARWSEAFPGNPAGPEPSAHATATEERDGYIARLEKTGLSSELAPFAHAIRSQWTPILKGEKTKIQLSPFKCFKGGCYATIRHPPGVEPDQLASRLLEVRAFHEWPGPKFRSGPIPGRDGAVDQTWVFMARAGLRQGSEGPKR